MSSPQITNLVAHSFDASIADSFAELFKYQFTLSKTPIATADSWRAQPVGPWILQHCPLLRVTPIVDAKRETVGHFIGIGIDDSGDAIIDALKIGAHEGAPDFWSKFEQKVETIAGRYALVVVSGDDQRMYFDNALDQSVVFNPSEDLIASSVTLAATGELADNPLFDHNAVLSGDLYFAFEHTRDARVFRTRPNHYLDLKTFTQTRHWPNENTPFDTPRNERADVIEQIEARLKTILNGLIRNFDCCLPVSGGKDSRLLLSLAKDSLGDLTRVFTHATNHNTLVDAYIGSQLCNRLGLEHSVINTRGNDYEDLTTDTLTSQRFIRFAYRTGFEAGTRDPRAGLADALSPKHEVLLRGNLLGLIGAQQYARPLLDAPFNIHFALSRLRLAPQVTNETIMQWGPSYFEWMSTLPKAAHNRIYDMAFTELVQPHALGALLNGSTNSFYVNPFNDRSLLHNAMRLRPKFRHTNRVYEIIQERTAPELGDIPFTTTLKRGVMRELGKAPDWNTLRDFPLDKLR
ncbi:MAG: hypothetical protein JXQ85_10250 [Cognatishimia sp.]|uniref:hypothetical protein n=1 Tax=Cognatishimia sp. TaxID=2211648 RepID=UPI003B8CE523